MESKKRTLQTMSPLKIGNVEMQNPLVLAPMAGVTDLPFRVLCKEQGAGLICMEMVSAKAILYKNKNTEDLMTIHPGEHPVSLQLFGSDPEILAQIAAQIERIQRTAKAIARLDVFASLALVAERNHYVRPVLNEKGVIDIRDGRHPVVEQMTDHDMFISNDTYLDNQKHCIAIITGPNMAGKSTYMRQTALIVLMAQIGSFVPAASANIGICDRIFTRVGASDDLASGQSTFMVEMSEVANILRNATKNSLLILDEIGRGTSTYDGLSIAWAVVEYISNSELLGAKTLFATHYHELTELEGKLSSVNNYCIAVKEDGDDIVFLRKIVKGGADRSYGIQVAKLAGVPDIVINRANEICNQLIDTDITTKLKDIKITNDFHKSASDTQMSFLANPEESAILEEIKNADLSNMTPMKALLYLNELQERIR